MLTIFSIPRPFKGHMAIIQRNAIQSWTLLRPKCEVILCSDEAGVEEAAREFGVKFIPDIARNKYGTPLMNSVLEKVHNAAANRLFCQVNADIILTSDFTEAVRRIPFPRFLMVGQRWNASLIKPWEFKRSDWERRLLNYVTECGTLDGIFSIDYFVFPWDDKLCIQPPFAVGRAYWDNWFIYTAHRLGIPVINATRAITIVHQIHGYSHVPKRRDERYGGPEADRNYALAGGMDHLYSLLDVTHVLTRKFLLPAFGYKWVRQSIDWIRRAVKYKYISKPFPIPEEVMRKNGIDLESFLNSYILEKIKFRGRNYYRVSVPKDVLQNFPNTSKMVELFNSSHLFRNKIRWLLGIHRRK